MADGTGNDGEGRTPIPVADARRERARRRIRASLENAEQLARKRQSKGKKAPPAEDENHANALDGYDLTEDGIALAFAAIHRNDLRYCHDSGAWFRWSGAIWQPERTRIAFNWARVACRDLANQAGLSDKDLRSMTRAATAAGVERFAQADRAFAVTWDVWDDDPFLLGTPGGTVDLRAGRLRAADRLDFITRATAVTPAEIPDCPRWEQFLEEATAGDAQLIRFLRQFAGYSLTGDTREHALMFIYGPGGNGKSVFLNTLAGILGGYRANAGIETFLSSAQDRHTTELARLRGARLVTAPETEEGRAWAEVRIKQLTGGDTVTARFMRQNDFEFRPQFKLMIAGNHKPILKNLDDAMRRRFNVVPFPHKPATPDPDLEAKLKAEWPAILRWAIDGCIDWQMNGLVRPAIVAAETDAYFAEQDMIRQWVDECCFTAEQRPGSDLQDTTAQLFGSWSMFAKARGEQPGVARTFGLAMQRLGFVPIKHVSGKRDQRGFRGIQVKPFAFG